MRNVNLTVYNKIVLVEVGIYKHTYRELTPEQIKNFFVHLAMGAFSLALDYSKRTPQENNPAMARVPMFINGILVGYLLTNLRATDNSLLFFPSALHECGIAPYIGGDV